MSLGVQQDRSRKQIFVGRAVLALVFLLLCHTLPDDLWDWFSLVPKLAFRRATGGWLSEVGHLIRHSRRGITADAEVAGTETAGVGVGWDSGR
jgi:hypothetical protein